MQFFNLKALFDERLTILQPPEQLTSTSGINLVLGKRIPAAFSSWKRVQPTYSIGGNIVF